MSRGIAAVLFDLDGTLTDTVQIISAAMAQAACAAGFATSAERATVFVGVPIVTGMAELVGLPSSDPRVAAIIADYRQRYFPAVEAAAESVLLPGARELLTDLQGRGYRIGIVTAKSQKSAQHLIDLVGLGPLIDCLVPSGIVPRGKPAPDPVEYAMVQLGVVPEKTWYVGDAATDMQMAVAAGMPALGITTGAATREQLRAAGATAVVDELAEVFDIVTN